MCSTRRDSRSLRMVVMDLLSILFNPRTSNEMRILPFSKQKHKTILQNNIKLSWIQHHHRRIRTFKFVKKKTLYVNDITLKLYIKCYLYIWSGNKHVNS